MAVTPVEQEKLALLGRLDERRRTIGQIDQAAGDRQVEVPKIVMDGLEVPALAAGVDFKRHDGGTVFVVERPAVPAPIIGRCIAERDIDEAELVVGGVRAPADAARRAYTASRPLAEPIADALGWAMFQTGYAETDRLLEAARQWILSP